MKFKFLKLLFLIFISCGTSKNLNVKPIFRYVNLYTYGKFELGDDLKNINYLTEVIDNRIYLKKNVFGGVVSIELIPNSKGKIKSIIFDYGTKTTLESEIKDYKNMLGLPKTNTDKAIWSDGRTSFELYEVNSKVFSKMTDLQ